MKRKPTIEDFADYIDHQLGLIEKDTADEIKRIERSRAAKSSFQSGGTIIEVSKAIEERLNRAAQIALAELESAAANTDIPQDLLHNRTKSALEELFRRLSNCLGDVGRRVGKVDKPVAEQIENWKKLLERLIRQFETGFYKPTLPPGVISMTNNNNSINVSGNMTGNTIQQGSPNAKQVVKANAQTFKELKETIERGVTDADERIKILAALEELKVATEKYESETGGTWYGLKYQEFIAAAANHMTLIAPFIPSLTKWL